jgi:hypothetical protein
MSRWLEPRLSMIKYIFHDERRALAFASKLWSGIHYCLFPATGKSPGPSQLSINFTFGNSILPECLATRAFRLFFTGYVRLQLLVSRGGMCAVCVVESVVGGCLCLGDAL